MRLAPVRTASGRSTAGFARPSSTPPRPAVALRRAPGLCARASARAGSAPPLLHRPAGSARASSLASGLSPPHSLSPRARRLTSRFAG
ncbi:hypothetical protein ZWY2020_006727 [Hordeum vulgare]|nr:hypothetical protein ZWY2020_006727 [Hordeum vulgare]